MGKQTIPIYTFACCNCRLHVTNHGPPNPPYRPLCSCSRRHPAEPESRSSPPPPPLLYAMLNLSTLCLRLCPLSSASAFCLCLWFFSLREPSGPFFDTNAPAPIRGPIILFLLLPLSIPSLLFPSSLDGDSCAVLYAPAFCILHSASSGEQRRT